jgi:hypothetical protein
MHARIRNAYKIVDGKPQQKTSLGRLIQRWEDSIKIDLTETICENMDWIQVAWSTVHWQAFLNMVMNLWVLDQLSSYKLFMKDAAPWC